MDSYQCGQKWRSAPQPRKFGAAMPGCRFSDPLSFFLPTLRVTVDVWATLANFCNILTAVNQSEVPLYKDPDEDLALLSLEEDRLLSGFVPLLVAPQEPCYVEKSSDKVRAGAERSSPSLWCLSPPFPPPQAFLLGKHFFANGT